jgi:hypothetical protein
MRLFSFLLAIVYFGASGGARLATANESSTVNVEVKARLDTNTGNSHPQLSLSGQVSEKKYYRSNRTILYFFIKHFTRDHSICETYLLSLLMKK